jgi:hypothetical protein
VLQGSPIFEDTGFSTWLTLLGTLPLLLVGALWFIVAAVFSLKGDNVDKPNRIAQLYGYTVCLLAVVIALVTFTSILSAVVERGHPLQNEYSFGVTLTSFDAYKATYDRERSAFPRDTPAPQDTLSDATLHERYDALVADRITSTQYRTTKSLLTNGVLLVIALLLFAFHWRWVRRLNGLIPTAAA